MALGTPWGQAGRVTARDGCFVAVPWRRSVDDGESPVPRAEPVLVPLPLLPLALSGQEMLDLHRGCRLTGRPDRIEHLATAEGRQEPAITVGVAEHMRYRHRPGLPETAGDKPPRTAPMRGRRAGAVISFS